MMTKTTVVSLFALSLLALTGIGYAAFTSNITITGTASAGTLQVQFASPVTSSGSPATSTPSGVGSCYFTGLGSSTTLTVTNMDPGDSCTAYVTVANTGTLPTSSETTSLSGATNVCVPTSTAPYNCFTVTDSLGLNSYTAANGAGGPVASGSSFGYTVTVQLPSTATAQGLGGSFTITLTASS